MTRFKNRTATIAAAALTTLLLAGCAQEVVPAASAPVDASDTQEETGELSPAELAQGEPSAAFKEAMAAPRVQGTMEMTVYALEVHSPEEYTVAYREPVGFDKADLYTGQIRLSLGDHPKFAFAKEGECGYEETISYLEERYTATTGDPSTVPGSMIVASNEITILDAGSIVEDGYAYSPGENVDGDRYSFTQFTAQQQRGLWGICGDWAPTQ